MTAPLPPVMTTFLADTAKAQASIKAFAADVAKFGGQIETAAAETGKGFDTALAEGVSEGSAEVTAAAAKTGVEAGHASGTGMAEGIAAESPKVEAAAVETATKSGEAAESRFATLGKAGAEKFAAAAKLALIGGAAVIGVGFAAVLKTGIDEQSDFLKGQAQLTAGLKSTGNVAGITVGQMEDLASSIQDYSGQTDDSIVATEQLLLTFTNIKNVAGQGNDVFTQTTKIAADMAARMGGDASSAAIQLGKALNDPVQGITALSRVGVSFTDAQKKQIAAMEAAGNTMGAQKVILGELTKEFGGSAKAVGDTLPGQLARAKRSFEDVSQSVVQAMAPALAWLGDLITTKVMPAFSTAVNWIISHWPQIQKVIVGAWNGFIKPALMDWWGMMEKYVIPNVKAVVEYIADHWPQIAGFFVATWGKIKPVLATLVDFFYTKILPAVGQVIQYVVAHWPQIQQAFLFVWNAIKPVLESLGKLLITIWNSVLKPIVEWVKAHWSEISAVIKVVVAVVAVAFKTLSVVVTTAVNVITFIIKTWATYMGFVVDVISAYIRGIATVVMWLWHNIIEPAAAGIKSEFQAIWSFLQGAWNNVGKPIFDAVSDTVNWLWNTIIHPAVQGIQDEFNTLWGFLQKIWNNVGKPIFDGISTATHAVGDGLQWGYDHIIKPTGDSIKQVWLDIKSGWDTMIGALGSVGEGVWSGIRGVFDTLKGIINKGIDGINTLIKGINSASGGLSDLWSWSGIPAIPKIPLIPSLAAGATILPKPGGTLALLAEAGKKESVVDTGLINRQLALTNRMLEKAAVGSAGGPTARSGGDTHIHVQGSIIDTQGLFNAVQRATLQRNLTNSNNGLAATR